MILFEVGPFEQLIRLTINCFRTMFGLINDKSLPLQSVAEEDSNQPIPRAEEFNICLDLDLRTYKIHYVQELKPQDHLAMPKFGELTRFDKFAVNPDFL